MLLNLIYFFILIDFFNFIYFLLHIIIHNILNLNLSNYLPLLHILYLLRLYSFLCYLCILIIDFMLLLFLLLMPLILTLKHLYFCIYLNRLNHSYFLQIDRLYYLFLLCISPSFICNIFIFSYLSHFKSLILLIQF